MKIRQKLLAIQTELKAPKSQVNSFGHYNYRNCEDILEALKPLLEKNKCTMVISDDIKQVGDRYYVMAEARMKDTETDEEIWTTAYAREELDKKGMDGSQITGASSSYARKYALNGLFLIDDTKDSDSTNEGQKASPTPPQQTKPAQPSNTDYGKCPRCGSPNKWSTNKNKAYCGAMCWNNPPKPMPDKVIEDEIDPKAVEEAFDNNLPF